mmetsp:Transcript_16267/g.35272  ORF Transcript_16267/g.35272 Transcript_16267/m.35272 type:complete len:226 (-) Transcript_16267:957-1634(-)
MVVGKPGEPPIVKKRSQAGLGKLELDAAYGEDTNPVGFTTSGSETESLGAVPDELRAKVVELFSQHVTGREAPLISGDEMKQLIVGNDLVSDLNGALRELEYMVNNATTQESGSSSANIDLDTFLSVLASLLELAEPHDTNSKIRNAFRAIDSGQRNGQVSFDELQTMLGSLDASITEESARQVFDRMDVERTGRIEFQKFVHEVFRPTSSTRFLSDAPENDASS